MDKIEELLKDQKTDLQKQALTDTSYKYRSKGKVPIKAIDNMVERLTSYTIDDDLKKRSDEARSALYKRKDFSEALCRDVATKKMKELAEKIPPTASFQYGKKDGMKGSKGYLGCSLFDLLCSCQKKKPVFHFHGSCLGEGDYQNFRRVDTFFN